MPKSKISQREKLLMKLSTIVLTLSFLAMMIGAGSVSAYFAFNMGHKALKGVEKPDINPSKKLVGKPKTDQPRKGLTLVKERDVIVSFYDHTHNSSKGKGETEKKPEKKDDSLPESPKTEAEKLMAKFPLKVEDGDVTMEVVKPSLDREAYLLNVTLKNDGRKAVKFLYSFLDVRDKEEKPLSAITDGLPTELPANGEVFSGTVKIPLALLNDTKEISLTLTDYPEQRLQLRIDEIPVLDKVPKEAQ